MIDKKEWFSKLSEQLSSIFNSRLLFVGVQGSYRRGEAREDSDIDAVVILDRVSLADLDAYRSLLSTLPESGKACGFCCGREELLGWPRYELFHLWKDTEPVLGDLKALLPPFGDDDVRDSVRIAAGNLYHLLCHSYLYAPETDRRNLLKGAYKGVFFLLEEAYYLRTGDYPATKRELLDRLTGKEREILALSMDWEGADSVGEQALYGQLLDLSSEILRSL